MDDQDKVGAEEVNWYNVTSPESDMAEEEAYLLDVDRMVNEGLGGGEVTIANGYIGDIAPEKLYMDREEEFLNLEGNGLAYESEKEQS